MLRRTKLLVKLSGACSKKPVNEAAARRFPFSEVYFTKDASRIYESTSTQYIHKNLTAGYTAWATGTRWVLVGLAFPDAIACTRLRVSAV